MGSKGWKQLQEEKERRERRWMWLSFAVFILCLGLGVWGGMRLVDERQKGVTHENGR